jgi:DNA-binding MarR family transcriptional regulator
MDHQFDRSIGYLVSDVARLMRDYFDRRARALGLTRAQWRVLAHLGRNEGINQTTMADLLEVENITLGRHVDRLEEAGWVERRRDPTDRRAWRLYLSEKAHPMFDRMRMLIAETEAATLAGFPPDESERLVDALMAMKNNLSPREDNAPAPADDTDAPAPVDEAVVRGEHV